LQRRRLFGKIAHAITALSIQDERIAEEFRAVEKGQVLSGKIVEIEGDVPVGMKIKLGDFAGAISTRLWQSIGRANWRPFDDARAFVRTLGLKSQDDWNAYCRSGKKPNDIPVTPDRAYADDGWAGLFDFLGAGRRRGRGWQPFDKARAFARTLDLKSFTEWRKYCKSGKKPP
jgi:hypothetical protein